MNKKLGLLLAAIASLIILAFFAVDQYVDGVFQTPTPMDIPSTTNMPTETPSLTLIPRYTATLTFTPTNTLTSTSLLLATAIIIYVPSSDTPVPEPACHSGVFSYSQMSPPYSDPVSGDTCVNIYNYDDCGNLLFTEQLCGGPEG